MMMMMVRKLAPWTIAMAIGCASNAPRDGGPTVTDLKANVGKEVAVTGRATDLMAAHLISPPRGKTFDLFDVDGHGQTVVYVTEKLPRNRRLRLTGVVLRVEGASSRPGERPSKADGMVEHQLDVSRAEPID